MTANRKALREKIVMNKVGGLPIYAFYMSDGWKRVLNLKERCHICGYPANIIWRVKHPEAHQNCKDEYYLCEVCITFIDILHTFDNFVLRSYIEETQKRIDKAYEQGKKDTFKWVAEQDKSERLATLKEVLKEFEEWFKKTQRTELKVWLKYRKNENDISLDREWHQSAMAKLVLEQITERLSQKIKELSDGH